MTKNETTQNTDIKPYFLLFLAFWLLSITASCTTANYVNTAVKEPKITTNYDIDHIDRQLTIIGDSITNQSKKEILKLLPNVELEAVSGIRFKGKNDRGEGGLTRIKKHAIRDIVVYLLASNGGTTNEELNELLSYIGPRRKLILMTTYNGFAINDTKKWNDIITKFAQNHSNIFILDWYSINQIDPQKYLVNDLLHPNIAGRKRFATEIKNTAIRSTQK